MSLWLTVEVCHFLPAKVAVQIVDYYNLALNTLDMGGSEDCSLPETLGTKIYKVSCHITPQELQIIIVAQTSLTYRSFVW
jgi:hypothetical protein